MLVFRTKPETSKLVCAPLEARQEWPRLSFVVFLTVIAHMRANYVSNNLRSC